MELGQVSDDLVWQNHPEFTGDEFRHLFTEEGRMLGSRLVAASFDVEVSCFGGPVGRGGVYGHAVVSPLAEQLGSWVFDSFEVRGKIGPASELVHEGLPGRGGAVGTRQLVN